MSGPKPKWTDQRKGFKHQLILALTEQGFSYREAESAVEAVFTSMKDALLRHESVELPFGSLEVVSNHRPRKQYLWGKLRRMNTSRFRIVLTPKEIR